MKKSSFLNLFFALCNLSLMALFIHSCQIEVGDGGDPASQFVILDTAGIRLDMPTDLGPQNGDLQNGITAIEGYPFSDGVCRMIFMVRDFDPNSPYSSDPPLMPTDIEIIGFSEPNGQGDVLMHEYFQITGDWQTIEIPESGYYWYRFPATFGPIENPARFQFLLNDFGWNNAFGRRVNIPYNQWCAVFTGYFAPKDLTNGPSFTLYYEYLCDGWCTWKASVDFENYDPGPLPSPYVSALFGFFYGEESQPYNPSYAYPIPRVLNQYAMWDISHKDYFLYPIAMENEHKYITETRDIGLEDEYVAVWYSIYGGDGQGLGPFAGWGLPLTSFVNDRGRECKVLGTSLPRPEGASPPQTGK